MTEEDDPVLEVHRYDRWFDAGWGAYVFAVERDTLITVLGDLQGQRLAEVGCGTGRLTAALEAAGAEVIGIDRDPAMLTIARERIRRPLLRGDATSLPSRMALSMSLWRSRCWSSPTRPSRSSVSWSASPVPGAASRSRPAAHGALSRRRALRRPPWTHAWLRTTDELRALLSSHGPVRSEAALYTPGAIHSLTRIGPRFERLGRHAPDLGAFQIVLFDPGPALREELT